jgi:hypothetical protein
MREMDLQSGRAGGVDPASSRALGPRHTPALAVPLRARLWLGGGGLAAAVLIAVLLASGAARSPSGERVSGASPAIVRRALVARLRFQRAHFQWVVCVRSGARFDGVPVVRCNVDFGDPHIEAYCSVFRGGRLLTSEQDGAIPCGPDGAGKLETIVTYN